MALANWKVQELKEFGMSLKDAGERILRTCEKMDLANVDSLVLQASAAMSIYGPSIFSLAASIDSEFVDQYTAAKQGRVPRWLQNQKKVEARAERKRLKEIEMAHRRKGITTSDSVSTKGNTQGEIADE